MRTVLRALGLASLLALGLGCSGAGPTPLDGGVDAGVDGGVDSGTPDAGQADAGVGEPPLRGGRTLTADVALLDQLRASLATASDGAAKEALVDQFLADVEAQGGTPLATRDGGTRVAFIARGAPTAGYSAVGQWNQWVQGETPLLQVDGTTLYAGEAQLLRDGPIRYKLADGSGVFEDLRAHHVAWDGIDHFGWGEFNAFVYPGLQDPLRGRLVAWRGVMDPTIGKPRDVFVYLPVRYDAESGPLPLLVFHDGNESLTRVGGVEDGRTFAMVANAEYASHPDEAAVLVFVGLPVGVDRKSQYAFAPVPADFPPPEGDLYVTFLADTLLPKVTDAFQLCPRAVDHGVAGASLGGLISSYAAEQHPELFGFVGSQSGSYFVNTVVQDRIAQDPVLPLRFYVDHGCPEDNCDENRAFVAQLQARGYPVTHLEQTGAGHDWSWWEGRLPFLLQDFRKGRTGCAP